MQALVPTAARPIFGSHPEIVYRRFDRGELAHEAALRVPLPTLALALLALGAGYLIGRAETTGEFA